MQSGSGRAMQNSVSSGVRHHRSGYAQTARAADVGIKAMSPMNRQPFREKTGMNTPKRRDQSRAGAIGTTRKRAANSCLPNPPFLEFEPASAVNFAPDLTGGYRVNLTWSATFGGKRRAGGDFGAHIADFWKHRAWRAAGSPDRAALARFPDAVRQRFVAGT